MKKTVKVVIEKEIEIDIPDDRLTPDSIESFKAGFWNVDGPDDLFRYAAGHIARYDRAFIEGLGPALHHLDKGDGIRFNELCDEIEIEVLEKESGND